MQFIIKKKKEKKMKTEKKQKEKKLQDSEDGTEIKKRRESWTLLHTAYEKIKRKKERKNEHFF